MTLLIASIAPALVIMYIIYQYDLKREPISMILKAFFGGVLSIGLALTLAYPLSYFSSSMPSGLIASFYDAFFTAAIPEELAKWLIFYWLIKKAKDFDQYYDGILYAVFISMGFALVENILYVMKGGLSVALLRSILSVPGHMLFAIPMGYFLSISKFESGKDLAINRFLSLFVPILLHGTYDFILMYKSVKDNNNSLLALLLLIIFLVFDIYMWRFGIRQIQKHRAKDEIESN